MHSQLLRARDLEERAEETDQIWTLSAVTGRLVELSGSHASASLTMSSVLIRDAQQSGQAAAWITTAGSIFFPPDMEAAAVDLAALPVVWAGAPNSAAQAAEILLRANSFGLVIMDLGETRYLKDAVLGRLMRLADRFGSTLLCITHKPEHYSSLGSMIALRVHAVRTRDRAGRYRCGVRVIKDKRKGPIGSYWEERYAPAGLR